eukprot:1082221-Amphidinium_carterae.1
MSTKRSARSVFEDVILPTAALTWATELLLLAKARNALSHSCDSGQSNVATRISTNIKDLQNLPS